MRNKKVRCILSYEFENCQFCPHAKIHEEVFENVLGKKCGCSENSSRCIVGERIYIVNCLSIH